MDVAAQGHQSKPPVEATTEAEARMTTAITPIDTSRAALARAATVLADRAAVHCQSSTLANDVLAQAYRRRAAELELAAWVGAVKAGSAAEPGSVACVA